MWRFGGITSVCKGWRYEEVSLLCRFKGTPVKVGKCHFSVGFCWTNIHPRHPSFLHLNNTYTYGVNASGYSYITKTFCIQPVTTTPSIKTAFSTPPYDNNHTNKTTHLPLAKTTAIYGINHTAMWQHQQNSFTTGNNHTNLWHYPQHCVTTTKPITYNSTIGNNPTDEATALHTNKHASSRQQATENL